MRYSLRYKVVTSQLTLPVVCVVGSLLYLIADIGTASRWGAWLLSLCTTFAIMEWNRRATLIRQRTRMASATFFTLLSVAVFLQPWDPSIPAALFYVLANIIIAYTYQVEKSQGLVFHAFLLLGLSALFFPPIVYVFPFFFISLGVQLRSLTWRSLAAGILGLLTPFWIYLVWCLVNGEDLSLFVRFYELLWPSRLTYSAIDARRWVMLVFAGSYVAIAMFDYIHTYYQDKTRTRMFIYTIILQTVGLFVLLLLLPLHFDGLLRFFIVTASPLIGHHLSLSRGRAVNWYFTATLVLTAVLLIWFHL